MDVRLSNTAPIEWLVSFNAEGTEAIASSDRRSALLTGNAAARLRAGEAVEAVLGSGAPRSSTLEWPADPPVFPDAATDLGPACWTSADELLGLIRTTDRHAYIVCVSRLAALLEALESLDATDAAVTPVLAYGRRLIVGPLLRGGRAPCGRCWGRRLRANIPTIDERCRRQHAITPRAGRSVRDLLAAARLLYEAPAAVAPPDMALVIDLESGEIERQRLLPVTGCRCVGPLRTGAIDDLAGDVLGLVHSLGAPTGVEPPIPALTAVVRSGADSSAAGACGFDLASTRQRALGEAAERSAAAAGAAAAFRASHASVPDAPPLAELMPYRAEDYAMPGHRYAPLRPSDELLWVRGRALGDGRPACVPALLVTLDRRAAAPAFAPMSSTGIAAGPSWQRAVESALFEIVERDVVTRAWYSGRVLALDLSKVAAAERDRLAVAGVEARLGLCLDSPGAPVVVAYVERRRAGRVIGAYGCAASATLSAAAPHALQDAAVMLVHRERHDRPCTYDPRWERFDALVPGDLSPRAGYADMETLVAAYRPLVVDLTTREARAAGVFVAAVWSPTAVDFPDLDGRFYSARWEPPPDVRARLLREPALFRAPGAP